MQFTKKQAQALQMAEDWLKSGTSDPFLLQGYAGTGKTTLMKELLDTLSVPNLALACPTGKAAKVLASKTGRVATTIHKLLYLPLDEELKRLRGILTELHADLTTSDDPDRMEEMILSVENQIDELEKQELTFSFKGHENLDLLVIDEASMVTEEIFDDIMQLNCKKMFIGDPGQLPPVRRKAGWDVLEPDMVLTEIVRTRGAGSGINLAAQAIRLGEIPEAGPGFSLHPRGSLSWDYYSKADLVLCGTNKLRQALNKGIRKYEGITDPLPQIGEKLISLSNEGQYGIVNGEILYLESVTDKRFRIWEGWFRNDEDKSIKLKFWSPLFANDMDQDKIPFHVAKLTHARAMTVHKSQGSEAERVVVCDNWPGNHHRRWLYTGVTRGKSNVDLISV